MPNVPSSHRLDHVRGALDVYSDDKLGIFEAVFHAENGGSVNNHVMSTNYIIEKPFIKYTSALRANIAETLSVVAISKQGGKEDQHD